MSKHTAGPWRVYRWEKESSRPSQIGVFIGDIYNKDIDPYAAENLINAAPDLLEELERAVSDLFYQVETRHGAEAASRYPSIVSARAAIARAKGEA